MRPKYLEPDRRSQDRWMASYLDILTILLVFFISVAVKSQAAVQAKPAPVVKPAASPRPVENPLAALEKRLARTGLDVRREHRGVVISLPQAILFGSGDDRVSRSALPVVKQIADEIQGIPNAVTLVGHSDAIPIHNRRFRNNWELSAMRGLRLMEMLTAEFGIDESRLTVSSDGPNRPAASNETEEGRAGNRRVEIIIAAD